MSVHPTKAGLWRRLLAVGGLLAALFVGVSAASADASWTDVDGNPTCAAVGAGYQQLKIDPVPQGRHDFSSGQFSVTVVVHGLLFDWSANQSVDAVIVKGGPVARIYRSGAPFTSGSGLHAPINPHNGQPYGLSHIDFCFKEPAPAPTPSPTPSATPTPSPTPTPTPGPCKPGGATVMPDGQPCSSGTPTPAPQGGVLAAGQTSPRVAALARITRPRSCASRSYRQVVRGTGIRRVTFSVNGHRVARLTGSRSVYAVKINARAYTTGVLRIIARVEYVAASRKRPQTLRATVLRCTENRGAAQLKPHFTG